MYTVKQLSEICKLVGHADPLCTVHHATRPDYDTPLWYCCLFFVDEYDDHVFLEALPDNRNVRIPKPLDLYELLNKLPEESQKLPVTTDDWDPTASDISNVYYSPSKHQLSLITVEPLTWTTYLKENPDCILLKV